MILQDELETCLQQICKKKKKNFFYSIENVYGIQGPNSS